MEGLLIDALLFEDKKPSLMSFLDEPGTLPKTPYKRFFLCQGPCLGWLMDLP